MPGLDDFKLLARFAPYQMYRYAMDWDEQNQYLGFAVNQWEGREPSSLAGVLNAYAYVVPLIDSQRVITVEDIRCIQEKCSELLVHSQCRPGQFRQHFIAFGVTEDTSSAEGLRMLVEMDKKHRCLRLCPDVAEASPTDAVAALQHQLTINPYSFSFASFDGHYTGDAWLALLAESDLDENHPIQLEYQTRIMQEVEGTLSHFYEIMRRMRTRDQKLGLIAMTIQRLEHIHPFYDCNCRTFCMVLLNTWLMQYGFRPTLINNPNKFDAYSVGELVSLIQEGMDRTASLCKFVRQKIKKSKVYAGVANVLDINDWREVRASQIGQLHDYAFNLIERIKQLPESSLPFFQVNASLEVSPSPSHLFGK